MKTKCNVTKVIFNCYILILLWIVLFKLSFSAEQIRLLFGERSINLVPFHYAADVGRFHGKEVILNVLVFIPLGVYLKMLDKTSKKVLLCGLGLSLLLEFCQFLFAMGASDITDLITNTFGTVLGLCLYVIAGKLFLDKQKLDKMINRMAMIALLLFGVLAVVLFVANFPS